MRTRTVKRILGIPKGKSVTGARVLGLAAEVKVRLVAARRAGDDGLAAELSQVKEFLKRRRRQFAECVDCGVVVNRRHERCVRCRVRKRFYSRALGEGTRGTERDESVE